MQAVISVHEFIFYSSYIMQAVVHCDPGHRTHDFVYPTEGVISSLTETKIFIGCKARSVP